MFFLRFRSYLFLVLPALGVCIGIGYISYTDLLSLGEKALAERMLYIALLTFLFLLILAVSTWKESQRNLRELERIIEINRLTGNLPEKRLDRFGKFGNDLKLLYYELNDLSRKRQLRILSQNSLIEGLVDFIDSSILVLDLTGQVLFVNEKFLKTEEVELSQIQGKSIAEILPELDFKEILLEMSRTHAPLETTSQKELIRFYPIHGPSQDIVYFIMDFGKKSVLTLSELWRPREGKKYPEQTGEKVNKGFFSRIRSLGRKQKQLAENTKNGA